MPISWLDNKPHAIAVYASWPALPSAHATLATGRPATALPGPVFHRLDRTSFCWRLRKSRLVVRSCVHVVQANIKLWIGLCHLRYVIAAAELGNLRRRRTRYREVHFAPKNGEFYQSSLARLCFGAVRMSSDSSSVVMTMHNALAASRSPTNRSCSVRVFFWRACSGVGFPASVKLRATRRHV
jgi:hypothetical protein